MYLYMFAAHLHRFAVKTGFRLEEIWFNLRLGKKNNGTQLIGDNVHVRRSKRKLSPDAGTLFLYFPTKKKTFASNCGFALSLFLKLVEQMIKNNFGIIPVNS